MTPRRTLIAVAVAFAAAIALPVAVVLFAEPAKPHGSLIVTPATCPGCVPVEVGGGG